MLSWEAKQYDFLSSIFQLENKRYKRFIDSRLPFHKCLSCMKYSSDVLPKMKLSHQHNKIDEQLLNHMNEVNITQSQNIFQDESIEKSNFLIEQWNLIMTPPYLLLPYLYVDDITIQLRTPLSDIISSLDQSHTFHHHQLFPIDTAPTLPSISFKPDEINKIEKLGGLWPSWIDWMKISDVQRNLSPFEVLIHQSQYESIFRDRPLSELLTTTFQNTSQLISISQSFLKFGEMSNFSQEIIDSCENIEYIPHSNEEWITSIRIFAPYSYSDQRHNQEIGIEIYDARALTMDVEDNSFSSHQVLLEKTSYHHYLSSVNFPSLNLSKYYHNSFIKSQAIKSIQRILTLPNQLVYFASRAQDVTHRNWKYNELLTNIMSLVVPIMPKSTFNQSYLINRRVEKSSVLLPRMPIMDPIIVYFTRLFPGITKKKTITPEESITFTSMRSTVSKINAEDIISETESSLENRSIGPIHTVEDKTSNTNEDIIAESVDDNCESFVEYSEIEKKPQDIDMGNIVNSYLRLHGYNFVPPSSTEVQEKTSDLLLCAQEEIKSYSLDLKPYIEQNYTSTPKKMEDIMILMSEDLLVQSPIYSTLLFQKYKIRCVDAPLELPLAFIIDEVTGVCLLYHEVLSSKQSLKSYLRKLTRIAFKFDTIWLVILSSSGEVPHEIYASLCQSFTHFPCVIEIRFALHLSVPTLLNHLCHEAANFAAIKKGVLLSTFTDRSMLHRISDFMFAAHCEFLQLFPTINYYLAARILNIWELKQLPQVELNELRRELPMKTKLSIERFHLLLHLLWH